MVGTDSYHHGDLRSALVAAGLEQSRRGGLSALGIRSVTREVGVTPNAAYRHFVDQRALVRAVAREAQDHAARAMLQRMDDVAPEGDPAQRARGRLRGVGLGYIHFALSEPGWFELAFLSQDGSSGRQMGTSADEGAPPPYRLLLDALDDMVGAGLVTRQRRKDAEWACWSTVHGFADLATRGPLQGRARVDLDQMARVVVDMVIDGLTNG